MPHLRLRHAKNLYEQALSFSPLVGIFGHRQVGKTTFLENSCETYYTFDDSATVKRARANVGTFLEGVGKAPAGIDECQTVDELFPALKEWVRKHKAPGQIVLSGSVRFYSKKAIAESLTGRIINIELLPMVLTELADQEVARFPLHLIKQSTFSSDFESALAAKSLHARAEMLKRYLTHGGLPGVCFMRNDRMRSERLREQLQLILDRDLRLVYPTTLPYSQLLNYVIQLSEGEGNPVQTTLLRKSTGIAEATQKNLLYAMENVFLIRQIPIEGKRKGVCFYFEDQAEQLSLKEEKPDALKQFEGLVFRNLRASFNYELGLDFRFFQYRERPDVYIPFAIRTKEGCLGILPILGTKPVRKDLRIAHKFLQRYSPASILVVTQGVAETVVLEPRILQVPSERLLFED